MSAQPTPAANDPGQQDADAAFYRDALHGLITVGTSLARLLPQQAAAPASPPATGPQPAPAPDAAPAIAAAIAFDRISRAVRRCIALARSLAHPVPPPPDPARQRAAARKQVIREVEDRIGRACNPGSDAADALTAELHDRLDEPDLDDDLTARPVAEVIAEICRDLGLAAPPGTQPWRRRTPADIADLCARAAAPSRAHPPGPAPNPGAGPALSPAGPRAAPARTPAPHAATHPLQAEAAGAFNALPRHAAHVWDQWPPPPA